MRRKLIGVSAIVVCVAFCQSLLIAATTEVSSVNVVGYQKISLPANTYVMVGIQFDSITNAGVLRVADVLGTNDIPSTTIAMGWSGSNYITETYNSSQKKWYVNVAAYTNFFVRGDALWVKSPVATNLTVLGQVPTNASAMVLDAGYSMMTYPYPINTSLTNVTDGLTAISSNASSTDIIMKYTGSNYLQWTYNSTQKKWYPNPPNTNQLQFYSGEAFWYKAVRSTNYTEKVPYSL